jgi:hypothetical protein
MHILELIAVTVEEFHLAKLKFYHSESAEHANIDQSFFFAQPISRYQYQSIFWFAMKSSRLAQADETLCALASLPGFSLFRVHGSRSDLCLVVGN